MIRMAFPGIRGTVGVVWEIVWRIGRGQVKSGCRMDGINRMIILRC